MYQDLYGVFPSILNGNVSEDLITSGKKEQAIHKLIIIDNLNLLKFIVFMLASISSNKIFKSGRSKYAATVFNESVIPILKSILSEVSGSSEVESLQTEEEFLKDKGLQKDTTMTSDKEEIAVYYYHDP